MYLKYSRELHPTKVTMGESEPSSGSVITVELINQSSYLDILYLLQVHRCYRYSCCETLASISPPSIRLLSVISSC